MRGADDLGEEAQEPLPGALSELGEGPAERVVVSVELRAVRRICRAEPPTIAEYPVARQAVKGATGDDYETIRIKATCH